MTPYPASDLAEVAQPAWLARFTTRHYPHPVASGRTERNRTEVRKPLDASTPTLGEADGVLAGCGHAGDHRPAAPARPGGADEVAVQGTLSAPPFGAVLRTPRGVTMPANPASRKPGRAFPRCRVLGGARRPDAWAALGDATGGGNTDSVAGRTEPGYGVSVISLRYVSAPALVKLLDSFAIRPGQVRADPTRNLLLIQGTGPERRNTMETALSFDVDWIRGQSVGIFPVQYSSPGPIIAELEKILDAGDGEEDNAIHVP
jgi:hypothetical protein